MVGGGNLLFFQILLTVAFTVLGGLIRSTKELATDAPTGASISLRIWKPMDDTLPLDFRLLEIDQKTDGLAGGSQIVDTLRGVLAGQPFHTFQLDHQHVFDEQIGKVLSDRVTLVGDCKRSFGGSPEAAKDRVL
jgi:hypothetical protein